MLIPLNVQPTIVTVQLVVYEGHSVSLSCVLILYRAVGICLLSINILKKFLDRVKALTILECWSPLIR